MSDENLLKGFCCPECGNEESFHIFGSGKMLVYEDGVDEVEDPEWEPSSKCECPECDFKGKVSDFCRGRRPDPDADDEDEQDED